MKITVERDLDKNRFILVDEGGKELGEIVFLLEEGIMTVDHTKVSSVLRGSGEGIRLVDAVVDYAKEQGHTVNATCKYAKKMLDRHRERYGAEVLAEPVPASED